MNFSVNYAIIDYHGPSECNCVDHVLGLTEGTVGLLLFLFVGHISQAAVGSCRAGLGASVVLVRRDYAGPLPRRQRYRCGPEIRRAPVRMTMHRYFVG